jgi:predicted GIY-YIG superfamily endonuclease
MSAKESDGPECNRGSKIPSVIEGIQMSFFVYILRTTSNKLYIGQTNNLEERVKQHSSHTSKSAHFLRTEQTIELVYSEQFSTRKDAMKREWQLKNWSRAKKEALVSGNKELLKQS